MIKKIWIGIVIDNNHKSCNSCNNKLITSIINNKNSYNDKATINNVNNIEDDSVDNNDTSLWLYIIKKERPNCMHVFAYIRYLKKFKDMKTTKSVVGSKLQLLLYRFYSSVVDYILNFLFEHVYCCLWLFCM